MAATRPLIEETSGQIPDHGELNTRLTDTSDTRDDAPMSRRRTERDAGGSEGS